MLQSSPNHRDPIRTGLFGIVLVVCLMLVSFGYSKLPFFPQGRTCEAFFADAGGIKPGSAVDVSGVKVGQVTAVALARAVAKLTFTVDRGIRLGDQSLAAVRTETVLGQKSVAITPAGSGNSTTIPLSRTTTSYTLNTALQDLGHNVAALDKPKFEEALRVLTESLHDATPQLRGALDGIADLSRSLNARDDALGQLLGQAHSVTAVFAKRAEQINQMVVDGNQLFAALDQRRVALSTLISEIDDVSGQLSGFVADNRREFGPALTELNLVLDNLNEHRDYIDEALKRLPPYATSLGEVIGSGPGFNVNIFGLPPVGITEPVFDAIFQPGKLPASLADFLRGFMFRRAEIRPQSP